MAKTHAERINFLREKMAEARAVNDKKSLDTLSDALQRMVMGTGAKSGESTVPNLTTADGKPENVVASSPEVPATPSALRMCGQHGINISDIPYNGKHVTKLNVQQYVIKLEAKTDTVASKQPEPAPPKVDVVQIGRPEPEEIDGEDKRMPEADNPIVS